MSSKGCWVAWPKKYFGLLVTLHLFHYKYMYIFFCELISRNANGMKEVTAKKKLTQSFYVLPPLYEKLQKLTGTNIMILHFIFYIIQMAFKVEDFDFCGPNLHRKSPWNRPGIDVNYYNHDHTCNNDMTNIMTMTISDSLQTLETWRNLWEGENSPRPFTFYHHLMKSWDREQGFVICDF